MANNRGYTARVNLRLKQETYDAYREAAEAVGQDTTGLIRLIVEASQVQMEAVAESVRAVKAGRMADAAQVYLTLIDSALAQGTASRAAAASVFHGVEQEAAKPDEEQAAS